MALTTLANGDTGLQSRTKINAGLAAVDAIDARTSNVTNSADADKPVSTAQQTALDAKQATSPVLTFLATASAASSTGVKSLIGLSSVNNTSDANKPVSSAQQTALDLKANLLDTYNVQTGTTYTLVAADLGKIIRCTNAAGCVVTGPNSLVEGFNCLILQDSAVQATFAAGAGATVGTFPAASLKTPGQNGTVAVSVKVNAGSAAAFVVSGGVA